MTTDDLEVHVDVAAPREAVWALLGDPTRMGELSPECRRVTWVGDVRAPAVGARFRGVNRRGVSVWATLSRLVEYVPGERIAWESRFAGLPVSRWTYALADSPDGGTRVVEQWHDERHWFVRLVSPVARFTLDAREHNRRGMEITLQRVRDLAEATTR
ncbi:SRPBCC family protein [Kineosporia sp. A_224]|uniref:SRPBCC family protein n=1 Tax=Kineosporia sp. A_224 TaxID=1962180 RepID=UPI000B4BDB93|nr:SRPBCC family protein [Kineosporia sp. A_224]